MDFYGANSFVLIDKRPVFEGNVIVRLVFHTLEAIYSIKTLIHVFAVCIDIVYTID